MMAQVYCKSDIILGKAIYFEINLFSSGIIITLNLKLQHPISEKKCYVTLVGFAF